MSAQLRVRVADGRAVLERRATRSADLVVLDAFRGEAIPAQLASLECARHARRVLRGGGIFAANVIDAPPPDAARALVATLLATFDHVALIAARKVVRGRQGGNLVLAAAQHPLPAGDLRARALRGPAPALVLADGEVAAFAGGAQPARDGAAGR